MFQAFGLKNFKSWKSESLLSVNDISLLFGKNSSGKSSLLQSLILLKASCKSFDLWSGSGSRFALPRSPFNKLIFANKNRDFGRLEDILHKKSNNSDQTQIFFFRVTPDQLSKNMIGHFLSKDSRELEYVDIQGPLGGKEMYEMFVQKTKNVFPKQTAFIEIRINFLSICL